MIARVSTVVMADHVRLTAVRGTTRCEGSGIAPRRLRGYTSAEGLCLVCDKWRDIKWLEVD